MRKLALRVLEFALFAAMLLSCGWIVVNSIPRVVHIEQHASTVDPAVPEQVMDTTVLVEHKDGCGSGVLFTKGDVTFVWTAAHVMRNDPVMTPAVMLGMAPPPLPEILTTATITQKIYRNGEVIASLQATAELIAYTAEYDVALLEVTQRGFTKASAVFYDEATVPRLGTEVCHGGNYHCQTGAFSLSDGIISHHNRPSINGRLVDQSTALIFPGSSGGGLFLKEDGRCIGTVSAMADPNVCFFIPVRIMREWARSAGVEWAMTRSLPTPADRSGFLKL